MPVTEEVRAAEREIDVCISELPIWVVQRDVLLSALLTAYSERMENAFAAAQREPDLASTLAQGLADEQHIRAGVFQALKWAMKFGDATGSASVRQASIHEIIRLGKAYELLVDALKMANYGHEIRVDATAKIITIYEGGDVSGSDLAIFNYQHVVPPVAQQPPIANTDQVTTQWTAGDFRSLTRTIGTEVQNKYPLISINNGALKFQTVQIHIGAGRNTVEQAILDDLTLTPEKVRAEEWKL